MEYCVILNDKCHFCAICKYVCNNLHSMDLSEIKISIYLSIYNYISAMAAL